MSLSNKNKLQEFCQKNKLEFPIYESISNGESHSPSWTSSVVVKINDRIIRVESITASNTKADSEKHVASIMLEKLTNRSKKNNESNKSLNKSLKQKPLKIIGEKKTCKNNSRTNNILCLIDDDEEITTPDKNLFMNNILSKNITDIYIIDLENRPQLNINARPNCIYFGFINAIHHSVKKYMSWHQCDSDDIMREIQTHENNKLLYCIDGGTPDLADHFMTVMSYPILDFVFEYFVFGKNCMDKKDVIIHVISGDHAGWCTRFCLEKVIKWKNLTHIKINNAGTIQ
ncbi:double-stranded RNA binding motif-containing protein [Cotonvirus japonicus]|uniref:Double-stranded RNA binding motif-containing protein n=1 Tax=Cotonvirus japonicus TaxID=2811091 RepID=A0ABM7NS28_9VIRU|nr:double-stranded RNA binding motif-containing protein [Cotonvirus japonicus]BCS82962.1 double-stranded RNA binding motif-containing protein [Cotonvirus japonicus]